MNKIEILAPAGDLERLKIACLYGADAVYIGGKEFSLRARASNFTIDDIKKGVEFAHQHNSKVYVTMNIIPHNDDLAGLEEYLLALEAAGVDAVIVASLYIAKVARQTAPKLEVHLSTQASISNSAAINFLAEFGITRFVLAREVGLAEIAQISKATNLELEVFIHGGMCVSYSGRCMLSNYMTNRDANRGGCAHSCRWAYTLYENGQPIPNGTDEFYIASKDLVAIPAIPKLIDLGVSSLKIEGRMKSIHYVATVVRTYRQIIDDYYAGKELNMPQYYQEIAKAENRLASTGFLLGDITVEEQHYQSRNAPLTQQFCGLVLDYDNETKLATIEQRNYFAVGDELEFFGPTLKNTNYNITQIFDEDHQELSVARHPQQVLKVYVPFQLKKYDMVRKSKS